LAHIISQEIWQVPLAETYHAPVNIYVTVIKFINGYYNLSSDPTLDLAADDVSAIFLKISKM
jgi:hypothetical protein